MITVAWPRSLRRWFKAQVSKEVWVRIPPLPFTLFTYCQEQEIRNLHYYEIAMQTVAWPSGLRRWFKAPVSTEAFGSNPTAAIHFSFVKHTCRTGNYEFIQAKM